ncbi:MAG: Gfo/Idh/MocA family oxidoreductase [Methylobacteriaceae bacterium]|nr:Gfo/Idh/MocA family oxidoreductase [Methylobacteriaceae bacterium]
MPSTRTGAPIRFGLVGTAYWSADVHAPGLRAAAGAELVGVFGRSHEKAQALAARHGLRAYARFEEMLQTVDAVSIAIAPEAQPDYAIAAARAGKHLLLDKPIARTIEAARAIDHAVRDSGVAAVVFFTRRFVPEIATAIEAARGRRWDKAIIRVHSAPMTTDSPYRASQWRQAHDSALWDIGPHVLSVTTAVLGPVVAARKLPAEPPFVRFATRHASGAEAEVSVTIHAQPSDVGSAYRFIDAAGDDLVLPEPALERPEVMRRVAETLVDMIGSGRRDHPCGVALGVEIVRILESLDRPAPHRLSGA